MGGGERGPPRQVTVVFVGVERVVQRVRPAFRGEGGSEREGRGKRRRGINVVVVRVVFR